MKDATYETSIMPSMSIFLNRSIISSTTSGRAMPSTYKTEMGVEEYLPTLRFFTVNDGVFNLRLMRVTFVLISSMKPSRGPFKTFEVGGSAMARLSNFRMLMR